MPIFPLLKPIVMYLIPDDFSPERLKGKTIEQVCYSINQIGLFWENGNIQIMGSFSFSRNGRTHVYEEIYLTAPPCRCNRKDRTLPAREDDPTSCRKDSTP